MTCRRAEREQTTPASIGRNGPVRDALQEVKEDFKQCETLALVEHKIFTLSQTSGQSFKAKLVIRVKMLAKKLDMNNRHSSLKVIKVLFQQITT